MKILIVVDMQNDFIDGALGSLNATAIIPKVIQKIAEYDAIGQPVIFTVDTHFDNYMETLEGKNLPIPHCILGTEGWEIPKEILGNHTNIIQKHTFGSVNLPNYIRANIPNFETLESIELIGVCTDICVVSNALILRAHYPDIPITVDAACCAGTEEAAHRAALDTMRSCQITILNYKG